GYASLLWTDVPAVFEVGAFSVFGVASVTLLALTGPPATLAPLPLPPGAAPPAPPARLPPPPVAHPGARPDARVRLATRLGQALDRRLSRLTAFTAPRSGALLARRGGLCAARLSA